LYTKRFEEETNLRCHIIIDNSSSMHYPKLKTNQNFHENKIGFSVLASGFNESLKETAGCNRVECVFSDTYKYYAPEKAVIVITEW
jgi:hypothetical protein